MTARVGDVVELVSCSDPWTKIAPGTRGVVDHVDSIGTVFVRWEDGSTLGLVEEAGDRYIVVGRAEI